MALVKWICQRCINELWAGYPWNQRNGELKDDENWVRGAAICPYAYSGSPAQRVDGDPPEGCPYVLEHAIESVRGASVGKACVVDP